MKAPRIVIIGPPNTGKSTLFNALLRTRQAITTDTPGTTLDYLSGHIFYNNFLMELVDTAGLATVPAGRQIESVLNQASVILFVTDLKQGITPLDKDIANFLRKKGKEIILVVNKADTTPFDIGKDEFYALGLGDPLPVSALQRRNLWNLKEMITQRLEKLGFTPSFQLRSGGKEVERAGPIKIAIVGKRNVGKSTLVNTLAKEERVIVSEIPGTTRDAIDVQIKMNGETFIVIDTAGLRRKKSMRQAIDIFSHARTEAAIKRADVVIFLLDAREKVSQVDKKITNLITKYEKPCVIVLNKWDLVAPAISPTDYTSYLSQQLRGLKYAPISFISAKTGFNTEETLLLARELYHQAGLKVSTPLVNRLIQKIQQAKASPSKSKGFPKMYYATQTGTHPPKFTIFVNNPLLFTADYRRYLVNRFREELPFPEVPIRIELRARRHQRLS